MSEAKAHFPLSPAEFDARCRSLERLCPQISLTSGRRSAERNAYVGGHHESKHLYGMARDYGANVEQHDDDERVDLRRAEELLQERRKILEAAARCATMLGLWFDLDDKGGTGLRLHVQGLPVGNPPAWWVGKYAGECGAVPGWFNGGKLTNADGESVEVLTPPNPGDDTIVHSTKPVRDDLGVRRL